MQARSFWSEALALKGSVLPLVLRRVAIFGSIGLACWLIDSMVHYETGMTITPFEFVGVVLGLLLVLRTNSGYDRWYEARKLWGGIVNQSRNIAVLGLTYGPRDEKWRREFIKWTSAFPHIVRHSLRGERELDDLYEKLGEDTPKVASAQHMPLYASSRVARLLSEAVRSGQMDPFAFHQAERERASLIDHVGACERILATPLASAFSIEIRRYLFLYLGMLPLALIDKVGAVTPLFTMLVAYPLLSLDQIGVDLQNPFSKLRLSHLPLDDISLAIENNLLAIADHVQHPLAESNGASHEPIDRRRPLPIRPTPVRSPATSTALPAYADN